MINLRLLSEYTVNLLQAVYQCQGFFTHAFLPPVHVKLQFELHFNNRSHAALTPPCGHFDLIHT